MSNLKHEDVTLVYPSLNAPYMSAVGAECPKVSRALCILGEADKLGPETRNGAET